MKAGDRVINLNPLFYYPTLKNIPVGTLGTIVKPWYPNHIVAFDGFDVQVQTHEVNLRLIDKDATFRLVTVCADDPASNDDRLVSLVFLGQYFPAAVPFALSPDFESLVFVDGLVRVSLYKI